MFCHTRFSNFWRSILKRKQKKKQLDTYVMSEEKLKIINTKIESLNKQLKRIPFSEGNSLLFLSSSLEFIGKGVVHLNWEENYSRTFQ